ncbi:hypothetical protein LINPERPRIM_LOCUS32663 [Linum perenne]
MGRSLLSSTDISLKFTHLPRSFSSSNRASQCVPFSFKNNSHDGYPRLPSFRAKPMRNLCTKAVISEVPYQSQYPKMGASSTGPIPLNQFIQVVVETAAKSLAAVGVKRGLLQGSGTNREAKERRLHWEGKIDLQK